MINTFVMLIKSSKQIIIINTIQNSAGLSNGMHCPHRSSNINTFDSCFTTYNRPYSWSTRRIIFNNKLLKRNIRFLCYYLQNWWWNYISWITLIKICFYNDSLIYSNFMSWMMLLSIVWMNSMSHISWNKKGSLYGFLKSIQSWIALISQ